MLAAGTNSSQNWKPTGEVRRLEGRESTGLGSWVRIDPSSIIYNLGLLSGSLHPREDMRAELWLPQRKGLGRLACDFGLCLVAISFCSSFLPCPCVNFYPSDSATMPFAEGQLHARP